MKVQTALEYNIVVMAVVCALQPIYSQTNWRAPEVAEAGERKAIEAEFALEPNGDLHAVWSDDLGVGVGNILYAFKPADDTWSTAERISPKASVDSRRPQIVVGLDGTLHALWYDSESSLLWYAERAGELWSEPVQLAPEEVQGPRELRLGVSTDGRLFAVILASGPQELDVFILDKPLGEEWSEALNLTNSPRENADPILLVDSDPVEVFFLDRFEGDRNLVFSEFRDDAWSAPEAIFISDQLSDEHQYARGDDGLLHGVWREGPAGNDGEIFYSERALDGTWSKAVNLSNSETESDNPAVGVGLDGTVHVVWSESFSLDTGWHTRRSPGAAWSEPRELESSILEASLGTFTLLRAGGLVQLLASGTAEFSRSEWAHATFDGEWSPSRSLFPQLTESSFTPIPKVAADGMIYVAGNSQFATEEEFRVHVVQQDNQAPSAPVVQGFGQDGLVGRVGLASSFDAYASDVNGGRSLRRVLLALTDPSGQSEALRLAYDWTEHELLLYEEDGRTVAGRCSPGDFVLISNPHATLVCEDSRVDFSEPELARVRWRIRFSSCPPPGCGTYSVFQAVEDATGRRSGLEPTGSWELTESLQVDTPWARTSAGGPQ